MYRRECCYLLMLAAALYSGSPVMAAAPTKYQGPVFTDPALSAIEVAPAWRDKLDAPTAVLTDGWLYYVSGGQLVAADAFSGERSWRYGTDLKGPLASHPALGLVLTLDAGVSAVNMASGEVAWQYRGDDFTPQAIQVIDDAVVVSGGYGSGGLVLEAASGELRFRIESLGATVSSLVADGILYWQESSGEPHFDHVKAFDIGNGRLLWQAGRSAGPLAVQGGVAYLLDADWSLPGPRGQRLIAVDAVSGKAIASWRYDEYARTDQFTTSPSRVFIDDGHLYLVRPDGGEVAQFALGGGDTPLAVSQRLYERGTFVLGPVGGRAFFETATHALVGAALGSGNDHGGVRYLGPGSPLSRIDVHGGLLYAGRTDGTFWAVELSTARQLFFARTGRYGFGPTLVGDQLVVVQADSQIMVLDLRPPTTAGAGAR